MEAISVKTNKGLTLLEVVITIAIFAIVMSTIFSLNLFGLRSFTTTNVTAENQFEVRMPTDFIAKKIRYADKIKILNDIDPTPTPGSHQIYLESGKLVYREYGSFGTIIGTADVDDYTFTVEKSSRGSNIINYTIGKSGTDKYDLETEVIALNLDESISGDSSGIYIEFFTEQADDVTPISIAGLIDPEPVQTIIGEAVTSPLRVAALMSDGTTRQVAVKWSPSKIDTSTSGYKSSTGNVVGTTESVTFNVLVGDFTIVQIPDFTISKNKNEEFVMPTKVEATISPLSSTDEVSLLMDVENWDAVLNTTTPGTYVAKGTVENYEDDEGNPREFTMTLIVSDEPAATISSIEKIQHSVLRGGSFTLPDQITANMSDGSVESFPVTWHSYVVNTSIIGTTIYYGTVSGYSGQVELELEVINQKLTIVSVIIQQSGNGNNDNGIIIVKGNIGASVILKNKDGTIMKNGLVIGPSGELVINNVNTHQNHGVKTVMLTMSGWENSDIWTLGS